MSERWLITGATGFIGSHLARALLAEGVKVHLLILPDTRHLLGDLAPQCAVHEYDGKTESVIGLFDNIRPLGVFHLASVFLASHETKDIANMVASNILLGTQLCEGAVKSGTSYFVNTGTNWQHYNDAVYDPVCLYAATKQAFEDILKFYLGTSPMQSVTLKLFDTYGTGDPRKKLINILAEAAVTQKTISMSPGEQLLDIVHINDVVGAFISTRKYLLSGNIGSYNEYGVSMGMGNRISLRDLVKRFETVIGCGMPVEFGGRSYRPREVMSPWTQFSTPPGWAARVPLDEGIREMVKEAREKYQ
ncbi:MAG: NAD(P)-dependent oxidoreductase [Elusimicrobiales bacterium]|jgi:nucleoside-diphosphate-sugar epimerase